MTTLPSTDSLAKKSGSSPASEGPLRPRGKAAVVESLIDAASELFADKGPDSVSVRDIAARANVNHALVHRHFETKEKLLEAVMHRFARQFSQSISAVENPMDASRILLEQLEQQSSFVRLVAYLVLQRAPLEKVVVRDGSGLASLMALMTQGKKPDMQQKAQLIAGVSLAFGFVLFEPFLREVVGSEDDPAALRQNVLSIHSRLFPGAGTVLQTAD